MKKTNDRQEAASRQLPVCESEVLAFLNEVKFKKKVFGGVDEADVWKKIEELNRLYERILIAERAKAGTAEPDHGKQE